MKIALTLCIVTLLGVVLAEVPECPNMSKDQLNALKALTVTEDIHDMLVGEFGAVWVPKDVAQYEDTAVKFSRTKINDKELTQTLYLSGAWVGNEKPRPGTLEKVDNGVYVMRKENGETHGKFYFLFAKNNVIAHFACLLQAPNPVAKELPRFSGVAIRYDMMGSVLPPAVQEAVDEAVQKIQSGKDVLGEIAQIWPSPKH